MIEAPPQRVKVVSLRVGYKSATVDEFVERHALDVNRSGIYLQTPHPLHIGTTLKVEIQLANGRTVIVGFGRVVWTRDGTRASAVRPPGMGVRFIKLDEPSTKLLDELVNARPDAGLAYEEGIETGSAEGMPARPARTATPAEAMFPPTEPAAQVPREEELTVVTRMEDVLDELRDEAQGAEPENTSPVIEGSARTSDAPEASRQNPGERSRRSAGTLVVVGMVTAVALALMTFGRRLQSSRPATVAASTAEAVQALSVRSASATPSDASPTPPITTGPAWTDVAPVAPGLPSATATATSGVRPKPPVGHRKAAGATTTTTTAGALSKPTWLLHPSKVDNPY